MANLAAQIAHWQDRDPPGTAAAACRRERSEQRAFDPDRRQGLIDALATRARVRLSAADRRCAVALADDWVRRAPDDPRAWLSQALWPHIASLASLIEACPFCVSALSFLPVFHEVSSKSWTLMQAW